MIADVKQPTKHWLADVMQNFGTLLEAGEDPSLDVKIFEVSMQIRLMDLPGVFTRQEVVIPQPPMVDKNQSQMEQYKPSDGENVIVSFRATYHAGANTYDTEFGFFHAEDVDSVQRDCEKSAENL